MAIKLPPPPVQESELNQNWKNWFLKVKDMLTGISSLSWSLIDFTNSSITDILERKHNDLQDNQGGTTDEYYHLSLANYADLTDSGDTSLHYHNADRFYALNLLSLNVAAPTDGTTRYFGGMAVAPAATSSTQQLYIPFAGVIKKVYLFGYVGTVGTNESIDLYFRLNDTSDYLIGAGDASVNELPVSTTALNSGNGVTVAAGDYFEIKIVYPTWATNPANIRWSGVVFVEQ